MLSNSTVWKRRLLRVPWTARRSNQSILKSTLSVHWMVSKLKLQYFGHLIQTAESVNKTMMLGKIKGMRSRGQQELEIVDKEAWQAANHWVRKRRTRLSDWLNSKYNINFASYLKGLKYIYYMAKGSFQKFQKFCFRTQRKYQYIPKNLYPIDIILYLKF